MRIGELWPGAVRVPAGPGLRARPRSCNGSQPPTSRGIMLITYENNTNGGPHIT